ncbi:MAG: hypothetical protein JXR51_16840 [Bacteroidales bacterium]|nr:hypothetical protein [Bacteroidales bacterium]MBN2758836.1 hypothetical protein [Bacteroidales bacterium]
MIRKYFFLKFLFVFVLIINENAFADGGLVAFYKLGTKKGSLIEVRNNIVKSLIKENFKILGEYNPSKDSNLLVITFTRKDLLDITLKIKDKGLMASVMRIGLIANNNSVDISLLNPEYVFYSYLRDNTKKYEIELAQISLDIKMALYTITPEFTPFIISSLSDRELKEFRFLIRYPSFDDHIIVGTFKSFKQGLKIIKDNLQARKGETIKVYELIYEKEKIALFGIGLLDKRKGEANFLDKLGNSHLAALPYELILVDTTASILHGKFRFPLYWSDLSMQEYRLIYKTPRDIEETMKVISK